MNYIAYQFQWNSISNTPMDDADPQPADSSQSKMHLQIVEQPPEKSVYKRNLKPNPIVMLVGDQKLNDGSLYVVPTLVRCDTFTEEQKYLNGNRPVRVTRLNSYVGLSLIVK